MIRSVFVLAVSLAMASPALAAGCHVDRFNAVWGQDTDVTMMTEPGLACRIRMSSGSTAGYMLSRQAQHGTVTITESRIVYTPAPGYAGQDQFVYEKNGVGYDRKKDIATGGLTHYIVNVSVSH